MPKEILASGANRGLWIQNDRGLTLVDEVYIRGALALMDACNDNPDLSDAAYGLMDHAFHFGGRDYVSSPLEEASAEDLELIAQSIPVVEKYWIWETAQELRLNGQLSDSVYDHAMRVLFPSERVGFFDEAAKMGAGSTMIQQDSLGVVVLSAALNDIHGN